jgi:hypothetical protein
VAARSKSGKVWAGEINSSGAQEFHPHFAIQNRAVEEFCVSGAPAIPLENVLHSSVATPRLWRPSPDVECNIRHALHH